MTSLRYLDVSIDRSGCLGIIAEALSENDSLVSLNLARTKSNNTVMELLARSRSLRYINLMGNPMINDDGTKLFLSDAYWRGAVLDLRGTGVTKDMKHMLRRKGIHIRALV